MACIFKRQNKDGSISWRVQIRRTGLKYFSTTFPCEEEAKQFIKECEELYCLNPEEFTFDHLERHRRNEFYRK